MTRDRVKLPDGAEALVCSRGRRRKAPRPCSYCERPSTRLCDYPMSRTRTCDRALCDLHTAEVAKGTDMCAFHAPLWKTAEAR